MSKGFMSAATPCPEEFSISCCKAMIPLWLIKCLMTQCEIFMFASHHLVKILEQMNQRNLNPHQNRNIKTVKGVLKKKSFHFKRKKP